MVKYGIPEKIREGFKSIIRLNSEELKTLTSIIKTTKVGEDVSAIVEANNEKIESLNSDDFRLIIHALFSLVNIFVESKDDIEKFTSDFSQSYKEIVSDSSQNDAEILKNNLSQILPFFNSVKLTVKAKALLIENPNNYLEARVISDIRIVFDENEMEKKGQYALIVHDLKLKYFTEQGRNAFFVSLNLSDLKKLKQVIERAIEKDASIRGNNHELDFVDLN